MRSLGKKPDGDRLERIKASPRWAGDRFRNVHAIPPGLRDPNATMPSLSDFLCGGERRVPRGPLPSINPLESWRTPPASGLRVTWLGHSTILIEIDGLRVLTDPVWGPRASPSSLAGPKRFQPVPVALRALPPVDLVLGDKAGVQLMMPRLGEAIEPKHAQRVEPWWRGVDTAAEAPKPEAVPTLPKAMSWPID